MRTALPRTQHERQSGINMVDLMMWLVIAALLLAAALQGIGYYKKSSILYAMKNDATHAAELVMARASSVGGAITDTVSDQATTDSAKTSGITTEYEDTSSSSNNFVIRSTSDSVNSDVLFLSAQRGSYSPGIHVVPEGTVIAPDGTTTLAATAPVVLPTVDTTNIMTTVWDTRLSYDANYGTGNPVSMVPCTTISVPLANAVDATIDWGDGSPLQTVKSAYNNTAIPHTYSGAPGLVSVKVTGTFDAWVGPEWLHWTQGCITKVTSWGDGTATTDGTAGFNGAVKLTDVARIPLSMTTIDSLLSANSAAFTGDSLNLWDVSHVTSMEGMFADMKGIRGDISGWQTGNVEWMANIFAGSSFNGDISKWDVRKVKRFNLAFAESSFNGNISAWQPVSAYDMTLMFNNATAFNQNLSKWNVSSVTSYGGFGQGSALTTANRPLFK